MSVKASGKMSKNALFLLAAASAVFAQTSSVPIALLQPDNSSVADPGLSFSPSTKAIRLGLNSAQVDLVPKGTEPFGVMGIRSVQQNSQTALDVFPAGNPNTWERAWMDVCQEDLILSPTAWHCAMLGAFSDSFLIGTHQSTGPYLPLIVGGNPIMFQDHVGYGQALTFGSIGPSGFRLTSDGQDFIWAYAGGVRLASSEPLYWTSVTNVYASPDSGLARSAPGVVTVTGGYKSSYGTLDAGAYRVSGASGLSRIVNLTGADGVLCTITFVSGLATATTCP